jgi:hypothetical protein
MEARGLEFQPSGRKELEQVRLDQRRFLCRLTRYCSEMEDVL